MRPGTVATSCERAGSGFRFVPGEAGTKINHEKLAFEFTYICRYVAICSFAQV